MNAKRLLLLTAVCLTIGVTEAPAQGFLNKLKNKGMKIIKDAVPTPVKDVTDAASNPERVVNRAKNRVTGGNASQSGNSRRSRAQATNRAATGQRREVNLLKSKSPSSSTEVWDHRRGRDARPSIPPSHLCSVPSSPTGLLHSLSHRIWTTPPSPKSVR